MTLTTTTVALYRSIDREDATTVVDTDILFYAGGPKGDDYLALIHYWPPWITDYEWDKIKFDESTKSTDPDDSENWVSIKLLSGGSGWINVEVNRNKPDLTPTISSLSWTPAADYSTIATGAALVESVVGGGTTQLMLVAVDPAAVVEPAIGDGEAILQIDQEDPFIVAEGDHFRFNDKEWWALNIICGPECGMIIIADEVAEAEKVPKIGDEIQFTAAIDWHGQEMSTIRWYYAKALGECFDDIWDLDWKEFARDTDMPAHTFDADTDNEITFFRISATNIDGATGEIDTLCGPIFNLWKPHPSWWDQLLEAIHTVNTDEIAHPIVMLSAGMAAIPGWTEPPFTCPICKQVFEAEDSEIDYAKHLMSHITAFEYGWFGK